MPSNQHLRTGVVLAVAALALTGCGGGGKSESSSSGSGGTATAGDKIIIKNFMFSPMMLKVKVGQMITVTNEDSVAHTITATNKAFDSGNINQNKSYTFSIKKAGTYSYICSIHNYMTGTIVAS